MFMLFCYDKILSELVWNPRSGFQFFICVTDSRLCTQDVPAKLLWPGAQA